MSTQPDAIVSCRFEYIGDAKILLDKVFELSALGFKITAKVVLDKDPRIPIVEPRMELTLSELALVELVSFMQTPQSNLHIPLDTLRRVPLEQNTLNRMCGKGEFHQVKHISDASVKH